MLDYSSNLTYYIIKLCKMQYLFNSIHLSKSTEITKLIEEIEEIQEER